MTHRPYLVSFAFRMTGSLAEAEDLVQETFLAIDQVDPSTIENHKSWLTKICSNKGLDHLKSARVKRETYKGPWLPDAIPDSYGLWSGEEVGQPDKNILLSESLSTSFLLLLEKLNPEERVVFLLAEVFEFSYQEIAGFLGKSDASCRKMGQRAREAISSGGPKFDAPSDQGLQMIAKFFELAREGNREALEGLLAENSEFWSDGGGHVSASPKVLATHAEISRFWIAIARAPFMTSENFKLEPGFVNGKPGYIISARDGAGWKFDTIISIELVDGKISRFFAQRNPEKLASLVRA